MAERLSSLAYAQQQYASHNAPSNSNQLPHEFNPRSVSFDIRTPEELAAVNEFLLALGRNVTAPGGGAGHRAQPQTPADYAPNSYFDAVSLSQLGLTNMPGMPGSNPSYSAGEPEYPHTGAYTPAASSYQSSAQPHRSAPQSVDYGSMYPSFHDGPPSASQYSSQQQSRAPRLSGSFGPHPQGMSSSHYSPPVPNFHHPQPQQSHFRPTPPLSSPHSSLSTPSTAGTPPLQLPSGYPSMQMPDNAAAFDQLRAAARGAGAPVPQLGPIDYSTKALRNAIQLKTIPSMHHSASDTKSRAGVAEELSASHPGPMEPKLRASIQPGPPARLIPSSASGSTGSTSSSRTPSTRSSLYPLLTEGDAKFRLPPLSHMYRSPSPPSPRRASTPSSTASSPSVQPTVLPSLRSITSSPPPPPSGSRSHADEGFLARGVSQIGLGRKTPTPGVDEITPEERRRHAELIRDLLVSINHDFKERFGTPPPNVPDRALSSKAVDVEMAA